MFLVNLFRISVFLKFAKGLLEIFLGFILIRIMRINGFQSLLLEIEKYKFAQNQINFFKKNILSTTTNIDFWIYFLILCLLLHGLTKVITTILLFKKKLWIYPIVVYVYCALAILLIIKYLITPSSMYLWTSLSYAVFGKLTLFEYKRLRIKLTTK